MNRTSCVIKRSFAAWLGLTAAVCAQSIDQPIVFVDKQILVVGDLRPLPVGRGEVERLEWSTDGSRLLIVKRDFAIDAALFKTLSERKEPNFTQSIWTWDRPTGDLKQIFRTQSPRENLTEIEFLGDTQAVGFSHLVQGQNQEGPKTYRVVGPRGNVLLTRSTNGASLVADASSESGFAFVATLQGTLEEGTRLALDWLNLSNGAVVPFNLSAERNYLLGQYFWLSGGRLAMQLRGIQGERGILAELEPRRNQTALLTEDQWEQLRRTTVTPRPVPFRFGVRTKLVRIDSIPVSALELWAKTSDPSGPETKASFAFGARSVKMNPMRNGFAFVQNGAPMVADLFFIDRDKFENLLTTGERSRMISNTKQVGLAIVMFAGDHDDQLPDPERLAELVGPYLADPGIVEGFVFTYQGERSLSSIQNPSTTELGFMRGPGGAAILYADGSVKWVSDNPKS